MEVAITNAGKQDISTIRSLILQIWRPTYEHILSDAQMDYMLHMMYRPEVLEHQFDNGHHFLILYVEGKAVGFAGYEFDYEGKKGTCKLHKIYLLPETQGKSLGKRLLMAVKSIAEAAGQSQLILNVNRYNKAFSFYQKLGMKIEEEVDVNIGNGYFMNDYVMSMNLEGSQD